MDACLWSARHVYPHAFQLRVWVYENNLPTAIGTIEADATEEQFKRKFWHHLPPGSTRRFLFRPYTDEGRETGCEFVLQFSGPEPSVYEQLAEISP